MTRSLINTVIILSCFGSSAQCGFTGLSSVYCSNAPSVTLTPDIQGGSFYGPGISGASFLPALAGSGTHSIVYTYCSGSYSFQNEPFSLPSYNPVYVNLGDNTVAGPFPIGFNFRYFCNTYSQFYISANGFITFTPPLSAGCCQGLPLPTGPAQNEMIAVAWTDLDPSQGGSVRYVLLGAPPSRTLLVSYNCIFHQNGLDPVTAEIMLLEGSDDIVFSTTIKPITTGTVSYNTTMGLQGPNGAVVTVPGRNGTAGWLASQEQLRFFAEPLCTSNQTVQVIETPVLSVAASPTVVCPGETVVLTANGASAYSWSPGNAVYASYAITPLASTVYTVIGSVGPCSASSTLMVNVNTCTGVSDQAVSQLGLRVSSDPFSGTINISSPVAGIFHLLNDAGQVIRLISFSDKEGYNVQIPSPGAGIYCLRALSGEPGFTKKLVLIR